jgi:hypothetical protein
MVRPICVRMQAKYYPIRNCYRIIVPARFSVTGRAHARYFKTKEEADQAIKEFPQLNSLTKIEIEAKIEPIAAAIEKLSPNEKWNLMRRLRRSIAREQRRSASKNGLKIHPLVQSESTVRYRSNIQHRLRVCLGNRLNELLKEGEAKGGKILEILGCTIPQLMVHLEAQFVEGMAWNNYGPMWHIDHIRPCSSFDLTNLEQQKSCFHFSNLQPLLAQENLRKGKTFSAQ